MGSGTFSQFTGYHNRRSIRLRGYDYSRSGYYFLTICIHDRGQRLFGEIIDGKMILNDAGKYANRCWLDIPCHFPNATIDEYVIMPNHLLGVIFIRDPAGANNHSPRNGQTKSHHDNGASNHSPLQKINNRIHGTSKTVGSIVRGFKIGVTKWFKTQNPDTIVWQRNYFDHIIRDNKSLFYIRQYIRNNPLQWVMNPRNHLLDEINRFHVESQS